MEREDLVLPASYANFYIGNNVVMVPTYRQPNDEVAVGLLRDYFPGRKVVGIDCQELIWGLGAFHCLTQQQPAP
jgi:agmatine deiminase